MFSFNVIHFNVCYEFDKRLVAERIQFANEYPTDKYVKKGIQFLFACLFFLRTMILKLRENKKKRKMYLQ